MNLERPAAGHENIGRARREGLIVMGCFRGARRVKKVTRSLGHLAPGGWVICAGYCGTKRERSVCSDGMDRTDDSRVRVAASGTSVSPSDTSAEVRPAARNDLS